jgi:cyclomaltodextrinase / maltogenic alpha-amylase / neopullulanase
MSQWFEQAVFWHVYPLGFLGAGKSALVPGSQPVHRLQDLEPWLDYLQDLGCNGLLLGPVFSSETHGYDTIDHYQIDARLGTTEDFGSLLAACRKRNVKVVLDGVFNHVGRQFTAFQDVRTNRQSSRYRDWFRIDWSKTQTPDGFAYGNFEGHNQLVAFNHRNPEVIEYVVGVMNHWLEFGINGWRLDAAYAVPTEFWRVVSAAVREKHPACWLLGEVIHGDYNRFITAGGLDSVTQYELWKAIWSSLNDGNFFELSHALNRHNDFAKQFSPNIFLGNHDVTRIATQLKNDKHIGHSLAILLTVPGVPSIYAGDEQAFRGRKEHRADGDDEIRPAFPAQPAGLSPQGKPTHVLYKELLELRNQNSWIGKSQIKILTLANSQLIYETNFEDKLLVVALNISNETHTANVLTNRNLRLIAGDVGDDYALPPHGWGIFSRP